MSKGQRTSQPDLVPDPPNKTAEAMKTLEIQLKEALDRQAATANCVEPRDVFVALMLRTNSVKMTGHLPYLAKILC